MKMQSFVCYCNVPWTGSSCEIEICKYLIDLIFHHVIMQIRGQAFDRRCNISKTRESVSLGHPNTMKRLTCSRVYSRNLAVDKTRNMEHPGTFRNILEHGIIIIIMRKIYKNQIFET